MDPDLLVLDLGTRDYVEVWDLQKELVNRRILAELPDLLILAEHPDVITLGRRSKKEDVLTHEIPTYEVERGGEVTYHGPGQLVGYPILDLRRRGHQVLSYLREIEAVLVGSLQEFGINASRKEGHTGVWVDNKKLASIGVAVRSWITYHGFALNINTDLRKFSLIRPCGLESWVITSMQELLGHQIDQATVKRKVIEHFALVFNLVPTVVDELYITKYAR